MKCKKCRTKISLSDWLWFIGTCYYCRRRIEIDRSQKIKNDSKKYWDIKDEYVQKRINGETKMITDKSKKRPQSDGEIKC